MNREDQINALESCLNRAVEEQPDSCHLIGLCAFVDSGEEYSPYVCELIKDYMDQKSLGLSDCNVLYLITAIMFHHRKATGESMSNSELRIAWENEWRNYIKTLRDSLGGES